MGPHDAAPAVRILRRGPTSVSAQADSEDWTVYAVQTATGSLYVGVARDVEKRVARHNAGKGSRYLRGGRIPVVLACSWPFTGSEAKSVSHRFERWLKSRSSATRRQIVEERAAGSDAPLAGMWYPMVRRA